MYRVTKRYDHSEFSCCFRQWRAESHCRLLHGYALAFTLTFEARVLDQNNWVLDFGSMKPIKAWLKEMFDHTTVIAEDDPEIARFQNIRDAGLIDLRVLPFVGCEGFARFVYAYTHDWLNGLIQPDNRGVHLVSVQVEEHGVNSAIYAP